MAPASGDCDACYCSICDFSILILDSVTIVPARLEYIPTSQSKYFAPCVPDFVVDSPRVFEGDWRRPATPSTVRRALHAALRTTLRTAARRNFCFFVPVGFFPRCRFPAVCFVRCFFVVAVSVSVVPWARLSFVVCFLWARGRRKSLFSPSYLRRPQIFLLGLWSSEVFSELS